MEEEETEEVETPEGTEETENNITPMQWQPKK
jgi:hypothetical protein